MKKNTFFLTKQRYYLSVVLLGHCLFVWKAPSVWIRCNKALLDILRQKRQKKEEKKEKKTKKRQKRQKGQKDKKIQETKRKEKET